jgi:hypothetical protein
MESGVTYRAICDTLDLMPMNENDIPAAADGKKPSALSKTLDFASLASYPVGIFAGWKVTRAAIRDEARKNLHHTHIIDDLEKTRETEGTALRDELLKKTGTKRSPEELSKALKQVEENFYDARNARYTSAGIRGTGDYWKHLRSSEKFNAIVQGATVSSIIIGAVILMTQSKNLFSHLLGSSEDESKSR